MTEEKKELVIVFDLANFTIGDLEKLESDRMSDLLEVFDKVIEEPDPEGLRKLHWKTLRTISEMLRDKLKEDADEKN